jgi:hypothetical protein
LINRTRINNPSGVLVDALPPAHATEVCQMHFEPERSGISGSGGAQEC